MKINKYYMSKNTCTVNIGGVWKNRKIDNCINIIKNFIETEKLYFSIYRVDGMNIKKSDFGYIDNMLSIYLESLRRFNVLLKSREQSIAGSTIHAIGEMNSECIYDILPNIFNYYLETAVFNSRINWEEFNKIYTKNPMKGLHFYIEQGCADIIFAHVDSGDFAICFNKNIYSENQLISTLNEIINSNDIIEE